MQIREGEMPDYGDYGAAQVVSKRDLDPDLVRAAGQVLVGTNRTRRRYNERLRERQGFDGDVPNSGERLVCLRNNKQKGLLNGSMWTVKMRSPNKGGKLKMSLEPEDGGRVVRVTVLSELFTEEAFDIPWQKKRGTDEFDYGYALTVHKAQGSQWDEVVLFDESWAFKDHKMAWLYTGVTRAAKKLTLVR
jgi:exodeoxyribonuclease-5